MKKVNVKCPGCGAAVKRKGSLLLNLGGSAHECGRSSTLYEVYQSGGVILLDEVDCEEVK